MLIIWILQKKEETLKFIQDSKPAVIFHCAAYVKADYSEDEGKELNDLINYQGTKNVVDSAKAVKAVLFFLSSDYVFDGLKNVPYEETDEPNPQMEYGKAKYDSERYIQNNLTSYYIIRTSWVFGKYGKNFVYTIKELAQKMSILTVVSDQCGRPTSAKNLVEFMYYLFESKQSYGIYHFSNDGVATWFEFAKEILKNENVQIRPVGSDEYKQKAKRPSYSVMSLDKVKSTGFEIIHWKQSLNDFLSNSDM
jgi:dTDP-4-dehydrorhamnose reductase